MSFSYKFLRNDFEFVIQIFSNIDIVDFGDLVKYLFGPDSILPDLAQSYFSKLAQNSEYQFKDFDCKSSEYTLSAQDCEKIWKLTFLNSQYPLGKLDKFTKTGEVERCSDQIAIFNSNIITSLSLVMRNSKIQNLILPLVKCFIPLKDADGKKLRENGSGCSVHWFKGGIFLSLPNPGPFAQIELCLNMVHELGHQCLMI